MPIAPSDPGVPDTAGLADYPLWSLWEDRQIPLTVCTDALLGGPSGTIFGCTLTAADLDGPEHVIDAPYAPIPLIGRLGACE